MVLLANSLNDPLTGTPLSGAASGSRRASQPLSVAGR